VLLVDEVLVLLVNDGLVEFVNDLLVALVDDRLMDLSHFLLVDHVLVVLVDHRLVVLMHNVLVVLMNHIFVVLVNHVPMGLSDDWRLGINLNAGSHSVRLEYRSLLISRHNSGLVVADVGRLGLRHVDNRLLRDNLSNFSSLNLDGDLRLLESSHWDLSTLDVACLRLCREGHLLLDQRHLLELVRMLLTHGHLLLVLLHRYL
jgi:hypothetical protein